MLDTNAPATPVSTYFFTARALLLRAGQVRIASLQSRLRLGYTPTLTLLELLESEGVVTPNNSADFRTLTPAYLTPPVIKPSMSARDAYISDLHATALHWFDLFEEGHKGHSELPKLVAPECFIGAPLRSYLFDELYQKQSCSLTDAALALSAWRPEGVTLPFEPEDVREQIIDKCADDERLRQPIQHESQEAERSFRRYAREIARLVNEGRDRSAHTRLLDYLVRADLVPRGRSHQLQDAQSPKHVEHVVPLAYLRDKAIELTKLGWHVEDVARYIRHFTALVDIAPDEARQLDRGLASGGHDLKVVMPAGWDFETGCMFDRLHAAGIFFDLPTEDPAEVNVCPSCAST